METLTNFLESSTIHGLVYISTAKKKYVKFMWLLIVLWGFIGAGVLIYQSFQDWYESPVKTTTETLPITDLTLPKVTVRPPKHTFTNLNCDFKIMEGLAMDNDARQEPVVLTIM